MVNDRPAVPVFVADGVFCVLSVGVTGAVFPHETRKAATITKITIAVMILFIFILRLRLCRDFLAL